MTDWHGLLDDLTAATRDTFGEPVDVLYRRAETGQTKPIRAIFDYTSAQVEAGASLAGAVRMPVLDVRNEDLGFEPLPDDEVTINGHGVFRVLTTRADSSKNTKLDLRKKSA